MTGSEQLRFEYAIDRANVTATLDRLRAATPFVELLEDNVEVRAADLAAVIDHVADPATKLIWTGNPLRAPLSIERLILQAAGADADLRCERTPEELARMLARSAEQETRVLLIVQQPETLDPIARDTLAQMAPHLLAGMPAVQILFCGGHAFQPIAPASRENLPVVLPPKQLQLEPDFLPTVAESTPRREALPLLMLLALAAAGAVLPGHTPGSPQPVLLDRAGASPAPVRATPSVPSDPDQVPSPQAPQAAQASPVTASMNLDSLRREFDRFLAQQPDRVANLTPNQRKILFEEYVRRAGKGQLEQRL